MEGIAVAGTVWGLYNNIFNGLDELRKRIAGLTDHPRHFDILQKTLDILDGDLRNLKNDTNCSDILADIKKHLEVIELRVAEASGALQRVTVGVPVSSQAASHSAVPGQQPSRWTRFLSIIRTVSKTRRTEEALSSAETHLQLARAELTSIYVLFKQNRSKTVEPKPFCRSVKVRPNPPNVVLDFNTVDEKGNAVTYEGRLKQAIMRVDSSTCTGGPDKRVIAVTGEGGMGKSCVVLGLRGVEEVANAFKGGIYEISLGMNATTSKLIGEVCECIEASGGEALHKNLSTDNNVQRVLRKAGDWFESHKVLFIVDDVWENDAITADIFLCMKWLIKAEGSQLVFTSRSPRMWEYASSENVIKFESRSVYSKQSRAMLLKNAGMNENIAMVKENNDSVESLLRICGGLPAALAIAGHLVRQNEGLNDPFGDLVSRLEDRPGTIRERRAGRYEALSVLLDETVIFADRQQRKRLNFETEMSVQEMMESFCVIKKQQFAPIGMLQRLWCADGRSATRDLMDILINVGLVKKDVKRIQGREEIGLRIHDLVHDHFVFKGRGKHRMRHKRLLNTYMEFESQDGGGEGCRQWWKIDEKQDIYIYQNLLRHLLDGNMILEAIKLLLDPRWTVQQIRAGGIRQTVDDYTLIEAALRRNEAEPNKGVREQSSAIAAVELIKEAVTLARSFILHNEQEVWFQLYGRLVGSIEKQEIQEYLAKVKEHAEKPWIRCDNVLLRQAGGAVEQTWSLDGLGLRSASFRKDGSVIAVQTNDIFREVCEIVKFDRDDEGERTMLWDKKFETPIAKCLISKDGNKVVLFLQNGSVSIVDVNSKETNAANEVHNGTEDCMRSSEDGNTFIIASDDHTIAAVKTEGTTLQMIDTMKHDSMVVCAALSADGERVIFSTEDEDKQVVKWNIGSGEKCRLFPTSDLVQELACSVEGRIASVCTRMEDIREELVTLKVVVHDENEGATPIVTLEFTRMGYKDMKDELQWSPDGRFLFLSSIVIQMTGAPLKIWCAELPDGVQMVDRFSGDDKHILIGRDGMLDLVRIRSLRWCEMPIIAERHFAMDRRELKSEVKRIDQSILRAKWNKEGDLLATTAYYSKNSASVCLWNADGKQYTTLKSNKSYTTDLTWVGHVLAVAHEDCIELWDTRTKSLVDTLRFSLSDALEGLGRIHVSCDGRTVVATAKRGRRFLIWKKRDSNWQWPSVVHTDGRPYVIACSANGSFTVCETRRTIDPGIAVYDENGERRAFMGNSHIVRRLWFDKEDDVMIEWAIREEDEHESVPFGLWRWREGVTIVPVKRSTSYIRANRYFHDSNGRHLATFETANYKNGYSARGSAVAVIINDSVHMLHSET